MLRPNTKPIVWDPADPLKLSPVTEEGKALVAAGKVGLGPMVDMKSIALWAGSARCSPQNPTNAEPLISIAPAIKQTMDPGAPSETFDWEHEAIDKFRREVSPLFVDGRNTYINVAAIG